MRENTLEQKLVKFATFTKLAENLVVLVPCYGVFIYSVMGGQRDDIINGNKVTGHPFILYFQY